MNVWLIIIMILWAMITIAFAHDKRHGDVSPPMQSWFESLRSGKGPCCSAADGHALSDVDWESKDGHYRVKLNGKWMDVPDDAVLKQPNLYGKTMVWVLYISPRGGPIQITQIQCFIPGVMI